MCANWGSVVFRFSRDMVSATNLVMALAQQDGRQATVEALATELGVAEADLRSALDGLARRGIVGFEGGQPESVHLTSNPQDLTMGDVAAAVGDSFLLADGAPESDDTCPGLREALTIVRRGLLSDLRGLRIAAHAPAAS